MIKDERKSPFCSNCGARIEESNFCNECGQPNTHKNITIKELLQDLLGDYFTFDSKLFRSFVPLVKKPGHLTNEYLQGKRMTYIFPMRLFVFTSAMFFFIMALQTGGENPINTLSRNHVDSPKDTILSILKNYKEIPTNTKNLIASDIDRKYDLSFKSDRENETEEKKLDSIIYSLNSSIAHSERKVFISGMMNKFVFAEMDEDDLEELKESRTFGAFSININDSISLKKYISENDKWNLNQNDSLFNKIQNNFFVTHIDLTEKNKEKFDTTTFKGKLEYNVKKIQNASTIGWEIFKQQIINQIPKVVFILLPIFALILKFVYLRRKILYMNHLIFSLHIHSVFFVYMIVPFLVENTYISLLVVLLFYIYLFFAFKKVYQQKNLKTFIKLNLVLITYFFPLLASVVGIALYQIYYL